MKKRLIATCMLIAYSAILVKVMVFKDLPVIRIGSVMFNFGGTHEGPANLLPFTTILPYLPGKKGLIITGINLIGNIVLLVPLGFLVPFVFPNMTWKKMLTPAVAAGFAIEGMQALLHVGIFDIDDIILNGLGVMTGYWAYTILANKVRPMKPKTILITAVIVIVIAAAAAFYGVDVYQKRNQFGIIEESGRVTLCEITN
jgi:glycopeptide antibiotics resistance protein